MGVALARRTRRRIASGFRAMTTKLQRKLKEEEAKQAMAPKGLLPRPCYEDLLRSTTALQNRTFIDLKWIIPISCRRA